MRERNQSGKISNIEGGKRFDQINNGNYDSVLKAEVMAFGFYDDELCVRVNY